MYQVTLAMLSMQCLDDFAVRERSRKLAKPLNEPPSMCQFALALSVHALMVLGWLLDKDALIYFMSCFFIGRATLLTHLSAGACFMVMLLTHRSQWALLLLLVKVIAAAMQRGVNSSKLALALTLMLYSIFSSSSATRFLDLSGFAGAMPDQVTVVWITVSSAVSVSAWKIGVCIQWVQNLLLGHPNPRRRGTITAKVGRRVAWQQKQSAHHHELCAQLNTTILKQSSDDSCAWKESKALVITSSARSSHPEAIF